MKKQQKSNDLRWIAASLIVFAIWAFWSNYTYKHPVKKEQASFTKREVEAMDRLVAAATAPRYKTKQAEALADVYYLSEADVAKPVNLWRK